MRYFTYIAGFGLATTLSSGALAQTETVDPFEIASTEFTKDDKAKTSTRLHKANDGDKRVSIYKSKGGLKVESMGGTESPGWMVVNLGANQSKAAQTRWDEIETKFTTAYGSPNSVRGQTKSWNIPAMVPNLDHAETTTVMLYVNKDGENILKLDRRKGGVGTPVIARPDKKAAPTPQAEKPTPNPQTRLRKPGWDGQPD